MRKSYDAVVIGGGHNGLVTAAFLARAGQKVLVLERRDILGGAAATEEILPGFKVNTGAHDAGLLRAEVIAELNLRRHGLDFIQNPVTIFAPQPDGPALAMWQDMSQTQTGLAPLSKTDAGKFPEFVRRLAALTGVLDNIMTLTPPNPSQKNVGDLLPWLKVGADLKWLGQREMMEFLRILPMTVAEFLDEWFESELLKGVLGSVGITGSIQGPRAAGTAFMFLYHYLGAASTGFKASHFVRGGIGQVAAALAGAAQQYGTEIRTGADVSQIAIKDGRAIGVILAGGEELSARRVISSADPRRTFFELVDPLELEPRFVRLVRNIRYRGCTARVNLALNGLPYFINQPEDEGPYLGGHILISPSLDYLERAYDDAKYGRFSRRPYLDVVIPSVIDPSLAPEGQHVMSITMQYAPYHLAGSSWPEQRAALGDKIVNTLAEYAPNLKELVLERQVISPLDWEQVYGLTEGSIFHGQMGLDQLLFMRPVAGWGRYRTPIDKLYLCGAGTHPGGGVTGAPGYNAAREILKDLKSGR